MKTWKLTLEYDGTKYRGWQEQINARTVQGELRKVVEEYFGGAVDLQFFAVKEFSGELDNRIFAQLKWTRLEDLPEYDFLPADRGLIRDLASGKLL